MQSYLFHNIFKDSPYYYIQLCQIVAFQKVCMFFKAVMESGLLKVSQIDSTVGGKQNALLFSIKVMFCTKFDC